MLSCLHLVLLPLLVETVHQVSRCLFLTLAGPVSQRQRYMVVKAAGGKQVTDGREVIWRAQWQVELGIFFCGITTGFRALSFYFRFTIKQ